MWGQVDITSLWALRCQGCLAVAMPGIEWCRRCFEHLPVNHSACPRCAHPMTASSSICGECLKQPLPLDHVFSPFLYDEDIAWLIVRFKHRADFRAGHNLFHLLESHLHNVLDTDSPVLLPVPSHASRCKERGFDPVWWMARRIVNRLKWPLLKAKKTRATPRQQQLGRAGRLKNQQKIFEVPDLNRKTVWLFDDVMTTGTTLGSLALACRARGARHVNALTMARTPAVLESASMAAPPRRTP